MSEVNRILYVDDEVNIRTVGLFSLVEVGGLTVETAGSGPEALAKAGAFAPDLILLDVMMPGMDGMETLQALRSRPETSGVPVVFMTAKVQPNEVENYLRLGALGVIAKPFDPLTLADDVKTLWAERPCAVGAR